MVEPSYRRERGPSRDRLEHPRAEAYVPPSIASFNVDRGLALVTSNHSLEQVYCRGWSGHKKHMDRAIAVVLGSIKNPEEREVAERAFTKLRMAL